jgi:putative sterol carrier protein
LSAVIERFAAMSEAEVNEYFSGTDVLEITEMIRDASDEELHKLIDLDHFRDRAVDAILDRFEEFADSDRLAEVRGVVRFELVSPKHRPECHTARFSAGTVTLDPEAEPDVTVKAEIVDFVRLVTGQSNAALLYLGGRLGIEGQEMLALAVGTVFTVPGSDHAAVDPTALDPVDVATAVATTSGKHMRAVMEGGFRPIVLAEVFRRFPDFIDIGKAADLRLAVGFRIGGRKDGDVDRYCVHIEDSICTIDTGPPEGQRRDATITIDGADFLRLATGQLNPVRGVLTGAMKVKGDRAKALALNAVMVPPRPRR